ncbi:hypothetical protein TRVL_04027 [Trypanosoma vivax]|nr:hypothetical protein TRVL_04027 [Trypanosoma vivax]
MSGSEVGIKPYAVQAKPLSVAPGKWDDWDSGPRHLHAPPSGRSVAHTSITCTSRAESRLQSTGDPFSNSFHVASTNNHPTDSGNAEDGTMDNEMLEETESVGSRISFSRRRRRREGSTIIKAEESERQRLELEKVLQNLEEMQRENKERMLKISSFSFSNHEDSNNERGTEGGSTSFGKYLRTQSASSQLTRATPSLKPLERAVTSVYLAEPHTAVAGGSQRHRLREAAEKMAPSTSFRDALATPRKVAENASATGSGPTAAAMSLTRENSRASKKIAPRVAPGLSTSKALNEESCYVREGRSSLFVSNGGKNANSLDAPQGSSGTAGTAVSQDLYSSNGELKSAKHAPSSSRRTENARLTHGSGAGRASSPPIIILTVDSRRNMGEEDARRLLSAEPLPGYDPQSRRLRRSPGEHNTRGQARDKKPSSQTREKQSPNRMSGRQTPTRAREKLSPAPIRDKVSPSVREPSIAGASSKGKNSDKRMSLPEQQKRKPNSQSKVSSKIFCAPNTTFATKRDKNAACNGPSVVPSTRSSLPTQSKGCASVPWTPTEALDKRRIQLVDVGAVEFMSNKTHTAKAPNTLSRASPGSLERKAKVTRSKLSVTAPASKKDQRATLAIRNLSGLQSEMASSRRRPAQGGSGGGVSLLPSQSDRHPPASSKERRRAAKSSAKSPVEGNGPTSRQRPNLKQLPLRRKSFTSLSPTTSVERESVRPLATDRPISSPSSVSKRIIPIQPSPMKELVPFCTECGRKHLDDKVKFCAFCGHKRELV